VKLHDYGTPSRLVPLSAKAIPALQRSADGKLRTDVVQEFLSELEGRCLDDRSCEIVSPRDRHVATVRDGAQQIARAIFHHW